MLTAFILFDGLTALDFVGAYDPLTRLKTLDILPEFRWKTCALTPTVRDDRGLTLEVDRVAGGLEDFDLIVVPGGMATRSLRQDQEFIEWLGTSSTSSLRCSVCTGALLLGAAGWLRDKSATTHPDARELLVSYGASLRSERVVDVGQVVTSGGVTAGIDLGLHLAARLAGLEARNRIATQMDWPY